MKKRKIIVHLLILALAIVCIGTGIKGGKKCWGVQQKSDYAHKYQAEYETYINSSVENVVYQYLYLRDFYNEDTVLVEDEKYGAIKAGDVINISKDKKLRGSYCDRIHKFIQKDYEGELGAGSEELKEYKFLKKVMEYINEYETVAGNEYVSYMIRSGTDEVMKGEKIGNLGCVIKYSVNGKEYVYSNGDEFGNELENYMNVCSLSSLSYEKILPIDNSGIMKEFEMEIDYLTAMIGEEYFNNIEIDTDDYFEELYFDNVYQRYETISDDIIEIKVGLNKKLSYDDYASQLLNRYNKAPDNNDNIRSQGVVYIAVCVGMIVAGAILLLLLIVWAGHKNKGDEAKLNAVDRYWVDVFLAVAISACSTAIVLAAEFVSKYWYSGNGQILNMGLVVLTVALVITVELTVLTCESLARRIKCKKLMETTLIGIILRKIYCIWKVLWRKVKSFAGYVSNNVKTSLMIVGFAIVAFFWLVFAMACASNGSNGSIFASIMMIMIAVVLVVGVMFLFAREYEDIEEGTKKIADGNFEYKLDEKCKFKLNRHLEEAINSIGNGLSRAVSESLKNERMKTELITNVSHDLKTPLTSIINYVDLLKREGLDGENAKKYLQVIDKKSLRLKNLTEDLVEASKLNAGAVDFNIEKVDIVQLVNQSIGEYEEKFNEKGLDVIKNIQEEPLYIMADGRRTWRVFENLYGNIYKYAMEGTRVYVDIKKKNGKVSIIIRNISATPLNFNASEITERFVRGDKSRTTEGSGLGLSIAKSIVERQCGRMEICLDGDLFKVEIEMNLK